MAADRSTEVLTAQVLACARERPGLRPVVESFLGRYFDRAVPDDLVERSPHDLCGAAVSHVQMAFVRQPGEAVVRVYLPDEADSWHSTHTVVDVVTDDMPFLVESVTNELNRHELRVHLSIHPVLVVRRDAEGGLTEVLDPSADDLPADAVSESYIHIEVDRVRPGSVTEIHDDVVRVLADVAAAVQDWPAMKERAVALCAGFLDEPHPGDPEETAEAIALIEWMAADQFTFLGFRDYDLDPGATPEDPYTLTEVPGTGLGILRMAPGAAPTAHRLTPAEQNLALRPVSLVLSKANSRATVHRSSYLDYIGLKRFGPRGEVVGERRFLGLFSAGAYNSSVFDVPVVRRKVREVIRRAGLIPDGHANRRLVAILETYPRDELFQIGEDELYDTAIGILGLQERQRVRLFLRRDPAERFVSCLVFVPRDRYTTDVRQKMSAILERELMGTGSDFSVLLGESVLARLHVVVRTVRGVVPDVDAHVIEEQLVDAVRSWADDLYDRLVEECGEQEGIAMFHLYADAFPASYQEAFDVRTAAEDIRRLDLLAATGDMAITVYRPDGAAATSLRLKIYLSGARMSLSDVLPLLENLGFTVLDERPFTVLPAGGPLLWIYDIGLQLSEHASRTIDDNRGTFLDAFRAVWTGEAESDGFNRLVLEAGMAWRSVAVVRAYHRYQSQIGSAFSQAYVERCVVANAEVMRLLMALFDARFNPDRPGDREEDQTLLSLQMDAELDSIASLDDDRILRSFRDLVLATVRTSAYQTDANGRPRPVVSLKFDPARIADMPLPRPMAEVFVCSPRVEGVHLRGGKVARGGIRWSDRREDFRTEVLGLMKAQMVKNAVTVPSGAKGGFFVKQAPPATDRDAWLAEGIECYRLFIGGLLDLTDNLVGGTVVPPADTIRHDDDDPYLVVAADKGTASFSDIANEISSAHGFWLGDAFASGGSAGYDHKKMGITARGAWESVKRHFRELGIDTQQEDFTVVGIGDMSGDVFGNGMLLSPHIRLLAAFDHRHVFLDPDPDAAASLAERARLFGLARSSWDDYDRAVLSTGGGVFPRSAKSIPLSPEVRRALDVDRGSLAPEELVRAVLCAPVDLVWNGGIGTYVKATSESHQDVGDKANDAVRVDAADLRCRVVGEGGNLGFTQRGRVELALRGVRIHTDAIDNSAGVDCSDHEVNIKILLDAVVHEGGLRPTERSDLLAAMTDDVAHAVLRDNYENTEALSIASAQAAPMLDVHARYIADLERRGRLDRSVEALPDADELADRVARGQGLTTPELAVLLAYTKVVLRDDVIASDLPEDPYMQAILRGYFPPQLRERFAAQIATHPLRREITATCVSRMVTNRGGTSVLYRLADETQVGAASIARCHIAAATMFGIETLWLAVEELDGAVDARTQVDMLLAGRRLIERATRWLLLRHREQDTLTTLIDGYAPGIALLASVLPGVVVGDDRQRYDASTADLEARGVPRGLAERVAGLEALFAGPDLIDVATETAQDLVGVAAVSFELAHRLRLDWLRDQIGALPRDNRWRTLARAAIRAELLDRQRVLTRTAVAGAPGAVGPAEASRLVDAWEAARPVALDRFRRSIAELGAGDAVELAALSVAVRAVHDLAES